MLQKKKKKTTKKTLKGLVLLDRKVSAGEPNASKHTYVHRQKKETEGKMAAVESPNVIVPAAATTRRCSGGIVPPRHAVASGEGSRRERTMRKGYPEDPLAGIFGTEPEGSGTSQYDRRRRVECIHSMVSGHSPRKEPAAGLGT